MIALAAELPPQSLQDTTMGVYSGIWHMASKRTEMAIEKIVAACDGNMRGALEALLLVNEHLEAELHQLYAAVSRVGQDECFETMH
jgi:ABC-type thiamin/hydroxymethylpyrimidine transport system permease subunit